MFELFPESKLKSRITLRNKIFKMFNTSIMAPRLSGQTL